MPAISVVLTVRDASAQLDACVQSLLVQTFTDFEVLCICSGAYTYLPAKLQSLAAEDGRFRLFAADVSGRSFTWRDALGQSEARYACLIDDNTVLNPNMLEQLYGLAERLELDVALANGEQIDGSHATSDLQLFAWDIRRELLPLHEAFSANEAQQLFDAVPPRSWDRLYRREFLLDAAVTDKVASPAASASLALTAIAEAQRIDYITSVLATHRSALHFSMDDVLDELTTIKRHLEDRGIYQQRERDFVNVAARGLCEMRTNLSASEQVALCSKLRGVCRELGISGKDREFFYQGSVYDALSEQLSWANPSVTVLMPSLNVAPFIRQAVESVLSQTLRTIEVLCIDAGSTDGTLEILREYEEADPRVKVIISDKRSYGYQMNLGLAAARGEYIGIVETDDFADPEMFETLYRKAKHHKAQVVKGNYYDYRSKPVDKSTFHNSYYRLPYDCLLTDEEKIEAIRRIPCIWSGIYEKKMLRSNKIGFLETPGASYQDTSFVLKVWATVDRAVLDEHAFLHYRNDNEASSVNQSDKVYFVNGEFASAYEYYLARHGSKSGFTKSLRCRQAVAYLWNYDRIADEFRPEYLEHIRDEFMVARDVGELDRKYFWPKKWDAVHKIMESPSDYYASQRVAELEQKTADGVVLSVVVNTCGCDERLTCCLESIARQDLPRAEVIFVDDQRDTVASEQLAAQVAGDERLQLVAGEGVTVSGLMAEAVTRARGTWVLFIDGASALESDAVKNLVNYLDASAADVVLLQHDEFDVVAGELAATGVGVDLGQRRGLEVLNAQTNVHSILQIADAHVANKVFRKGFIEREQLRFVDDALNGDIAFCELGLLKAGSVEVNEGTFVDVLVGVDDARDAELKLHPEAAVDAWVALLEEASRQGLLVSHAETLVNAAAQQLADDMETLRGCYDARASLCTTIAGSKALASGISSQGRQYYASEWVADHVCGAVQAVAFTGAGEVDPRLQQAASAIADVRDAVFGDSAYEAKPLTDLVDCVVEAVREAGGAAEFLWWCLPAREQQVLDQLIVAKLRDQEAFNNDAARETGLRAGRDEAKHQLLLAQRELAVTKKRLATAEKNLKAQKKNLEAQKKKLEAQKKELEAQKKELEAQKKKLEAQKKQAAEDIRLAKEAVRASRSYRLGNALGAPWRVARALRNKIQGQ